MGEAGVGTADAQKGHQLTTGVDGRGDAVFAHAPFALYGAVAPLGGEPDRFPHGFQILHRLQRKAHRLLPEQMLQLPGGKISQQHLAVGGVPEGRDLIGVILQPDAEGRIHLIDDQRTAGMGNTEHQGFLGVLHQPFHGGLGAANQGRVPPLGCGTQHGGPIAQIIVLGFRVAAKKMVLFQGGEKPPDGGAVESRPLTENGQGYRTVFLTDHL